MSASFTPTCGLAAATLSILTAMTGPFGGAPTPVSGLTGFGFGLTAGAGVGVGLGVGVALGEASRTGAVGCPEQPHAWPPSAVASRMPSSRARRTATGRSCGVLTRAAYEAGRLRAPAAGRGHLVG